MWMILVWTNKNDPFSEITAYGPFQTESDAREWAKSHFGVYWRIARQVKPLQ